MSLSNVVRRLSRGDLAREPRSLAVIAYYDGWGQAHGMPPKEYPRPITTAEAAHWREGWADGKAELANTPS